MAQIADLRKSITKMDDQEAFNLIKEIRFLRRQLPPKKSRKTVKITKPKSAKSLVSSMTAEQKANLLRELEGL